VAPNAGVTREADIRIATSTVYADVRITQPGAIATEVIYTDDFGTGASNASGSWPSVTDWTAWNKSGAGAANVTYSIEGGSVTVRSNATSTSYTDASGGNNVMMAAVGASFLINNIDPVGMTNMTLSFGVNVTSSILKVYWKTGNDWTEAPFEKTSESWELRTVNFDIPEGSTVLHLKFTAGAYQYGSRVDDVKLTGTGGSGAPTGDLSVSPTSLSFVAGGEAKSFTVTSTKSWTVTSSGTWCTVSPANGSNSATINVTAAANTGAQRTTTITVTTTGENPESKTVTVTQAGASPGTNAIYYEDMGSATVTSNTDIANHTGWSKAGSGGSGVTYAGNAQVRTSVASKGYNGASGGNEVFFGTVPRHFIVQGIALSNVDNITLTFGASKVKNNKWDAFADGDLTLSYSSDGAQWFPVNWAFASAPETGSADTWALASAEIPTTGISSLSLKWECTIASVVRIDDIMAVPSSGAPTSFLNISTNNLDFAAAGEQKSFSITSNTAWTITSNETWCTVSFPSGSNNATINVTATANTGAARAATITVSGTGVTGSKTIAVTQAAPETPQAQLSENWENGTAGPGQSAAINGWTFAKVLGNDDKKFELREFSSNKYAYASAHEGTAANYELWLISPALDISNATSKTASFKTVGGYFQSTSSLEVYVLDSKSAGTTNGTKLTAKIAESTDIPSGGTYTDWIFSGDIDLSSFSGVKYIGFRYVAAGGASNSTTYEIDDFLFGATAPKELKVNTESLSFAAAGEQKSFSITSNTAWTVNSNESWCTVSPANGSNDATINVTATANTGAARAATITVSGTGVTGNKTIAVTQAGTSSGNTFEKVEFDFSTISAAGSNLTSYISKDESATLTTTANNGKFSSSTNSSGNSIWTGNWGETNEALKSWNIGIPLSGFTGGTLTLTFYSWGTAKGPKEWAVEWSADNNTWSTPTDEQKYTVTTTAYTSVYSKTIAPSGLTNMLYIRLRPTGTTTIDGTASGTGNNRLGINLTIEQK
jgi:hypothetical protein